MNKRTKKRDLPTKLCSNCCRPMVWRKKWASVWDEVKYCSERCRRDKQNQRAKPHREPRGVDSNQGTISNAKA